MVELIIREDLTPKQRRTLVAKLNHEGFGVHRQGHIHVAQPKPSHPVSYGTIYRDFADALNQTGCHYDLPVGFLGPKFAELVNTEIPFPENYHTRVRRIIESV